MLNVLILQDTTKTQGKKRTEVSRRKKGTCHALRIKKDVVLLFVAFRCIFVLTDLLRVETINGTGCSLTSFPGSTQLSRWRLRAEKSRHLESGVGPANEVDCCYPLQRSPVSFEQSDSCTQTWHCQCKPYQSFLFVFLHSDSFSLVFFWTLVDSNVNECLFNLWIAQESWFIFQFICQCQSSPNTEYLR